MPKQPYTPNLITVEQVKAEEEALRSGDSILNAKRNRRKIIARRPNSGECCSVCGKVLYDYELPWGKCLSHKHGGIIATREGRVYATTSATRNHTQP